MVELLEHVLRVGQQLLESPFQHVLELRNYLCPTPDNVKNSKNYYHTYGCFNDSASETMTSLKISYFEKAQELGFLASWTRNIKMNEINERMQHLKHLNMHLHS